MLVVLATIVGIAASPPAAAAGRATRWTLTPKTEGWELRWRGTRQLMVSVSVAQPMSVDYTAQLTFGASAGPLAALDSDDVTPEFFVRWAQYDPPPLPLALSAAGLYFRLQIPAGATTGTVEIPLKADGVSEGTEAFSLNVYDYDYGSLVGRIYGTVTD